MLPEPHCRKQSQRAVRGSQEKRPCCDEQPKAHAPEMPRDALCSKNTAAHQHANVPRGCQQHHRADEKAHPNGNAIFWRHAAEDLFQTDEPRPGPACQRNQKHCPIEAPRFPVTAPGGQPCRCDQVKRQDARQNIRRLVPRDGKVHREGGHDEHGGDKDLSRQHMAGGTFAERHGRGPRQQRQGPSANMHNQYGRIGHRSFLENYTWIGAPKFQPTAISTVAIPAVPFLVCDPRAPTPKSSRSSPATSPPTAAIPLSETSCAAAQTHARPAHTNASLREPQPSSAQCSKPASRLRCPHGHPPPAAKT